jgi:hypothetical protein
MGLLNRKKNGDYFVEMIKTLTETSLNVSHLKEGFGDHVKAGRIQRTEDKEWQKGVNLKLTECPKTEQIGNIQGDVDTLKIDKVKSEGKFLGVKSVYAVVIGALGFIAIVLGILWRLGLL